MRRADDRFSQLDYDDFRRLARDDRLSVHEKIGFPDSYREGFTSSIFADIEAKLPALSNPGARVLDIGCGCGDLARFVIARTGRRRQKLALVDSDEMLSLLPSPQHVTKVPGYFPNLPAFLKRATGSYDVVIAYSVVQYAFAAGCLFGFLDNAVACLDHGGSLLVGDVPNVSMRKRFLLSDEGARFHRRFMRTRKRPKVEVVGIAHEQIDDAVVAAIVQRYRGFGYNAYVLPQNAALPMANRREDILVTRL